MKYNVYKNQTIASTYEDSQGEKQTKEFFEKLIKQFHPRIPLHQHHDMGKETLGYMENFKIIQDSKNENEWLVKADVYITSKNIDETLKGFSYSILEKYKGNFENPNYHIYLPYPLYNDTKLIQELENNREFLIGKWIKKSLDPTAIGLIATTLALILAPEWDIQYKEKIRPMIKKLFDYIPYFEKKGISVDFVQRIYTEDHKTIQIYFIPDRKDLKSSYNEYFIYLAFQEVEKILKENPNYLIKGVERIKLFFDNSLKEYKIFHIQFLDGTDLNII